MRQRLEEIFGQRKIDLIHSAYIVSTLYQQQKLGKYCDLKVLVGEKQYFVHRCILAAASAQLDSQINGLDTIQLVGVTYYGFECLLEVLYSGKLRDIASLSDAKFQQIVSAADALNAETVMEYCTRERGDLMTILLQRSAAANNEVSQQSTGQTPNGSQSEIADTSAEKQSGIPIKTEFQDPHSHQRDHGSVGDVHSTMRPGMEQEYGEAPVAAEVEVGSFHAQQTEAQMQSDHLKKDTSGNPATENFVQSSQYGGGNVNPEEYEEDEEDDYDSETSLTCRVCTASFLNTADLKTHMHTHVGDKLFRCEICGLHFKFQANLWKHKETHKTETTCAVCGEDLKVPKALQNHIQEVHPELLGPQYATDAANLKGNRYARKKSGITPSMERNKTSACEALISPVVVNDIMRGENGKYQCPLCERGFDRRWNLKCHVLIHTAAQKKGPSSVGDYRYLEGGFTCPECGKPFRNLHNLRRHASSMHGMNASDLAEASDPGNRQEYAGAQQRKPRAQQPKKFEPSQEDFKFWCSICGRGFKRNRNLRGHLESHQSQNEGVSRYDCPVCGRRFAQKESLNGHLWVHGGKNEETGLPGMELPPQPNAELMTSPGMEMMTSHPHPPPPPVMDAMVTTQQPLSLPPPPPQVMGMAPPSME